VIKNEKTWDGSLEMSRGKFREDPHNLIRISNDSLSLFTRAKNKKSINMYSLFDGSVIMKS
jgi:hypothetical protein